MRLAAMRLSMMRLVAFDWVYQVCYANIIDKQEAWQRALRHDSALNGVVDRKLQRDISFIFASNAL